MSTAIAKVAVAVVANTQGFSNGMQRAQKDVRSFSMSVRKEQDTFDRLKNTFGESSRFGKLAQILGGAGAAGAAMILARTLGNAAEQMGKVANEVRAGEKGMGDLAEAALGVIPVFGQIWQAGRQIRNGMLDVGAAIAGWLGASQSTVDYLESWETKFARLSEEEKLIAALQDGLAKAQAKLRQETLTGVAKEKAAIEDRYASEMRMIEELRRQVDSVKAEGNRTTGLLALKQLADTLKAIRDAELSKVQFQGIQASGPKTIAARQAGESGQTDMSRFINGQRELNEKLLAASGAVVKSIDFAEQKIGRLVTEAIQVLRYGLGATPGI